MCIVKKGRLGQRTIMKMNERGKRSGHRTRKKTDKKNRTKGKSEDENTWIEKESEMHCDGMKKRGVEGEENDSKEPGEEKES